MGRRKKRDEDKRDGLWIAIHAKRPPALSYFAASKQIVFSCASSAQLRVLNPYIFRSGRQVNIIPSTIGCLTSCQWLERLAGVAGLIGVHDDSLLLNAC